MSIIGYRYYDTPDGQDWEKKTYYLVRKSILPAAFLANADLLLISKPIGWVPTIVKYYSTLFKLPGACVIYSTTTYMATKLRKKDDPWNHVLASTFTMMFLNKTMINNWAITSYTAFVVGIIAYLCKEEKLKGAMLFHDYFNCRDESSSGLFSRQLNDWAWQRKYPREWLYAEEVANQKQA